MKNLGYYNGKIGEIEEISIPMTDRAFYFGDGVYDAVMCRNNIPYLLCEHINRLYENCHLLGITVPKTKEELSHIIKELCKRVDGNEKFVYFHVSRGSGIRDHAFCEGNGNLCIMIKPQNVGDVYEKVDLCTTNDYRYGYCNIKTLNLLPSVLAAQLSKDNKCEEAIFIRDGYVTECSHSNVSILKNGELITAPADRHILPGVTRAHLIKKAKEAGILVREEKYTEKELFEADEILISSSSKMIKSAKRLNGKSVGGKDFKNLTYLQCAIYSDYLTNTTIK
ncbi:MAG: aminotransferase class IV [Clostridia bacterium]|nr:aminotransferase class IV [Clostridia bacterium]